MAAPWAKLTLSGEGQQGRRIAAHLFRITIGPGIFAHRAGGVDAVARRRTIDPIPHRENGAGGITAGNEGQRRPDGVNARADRGFNRVDADGLNPHHRLAGPRNQVRHVLVTQHRTIAEIVYPHRFHGRRSP